MEDHGGDFDRRRGRIRGFLITAKLIMDGSWPAKIAKKGRNQDEVMIIARADDQDRTFPLNSGQGTLHAC